MAALFLITACLFCFTLAIARHGKRKPIPAPTIVSVFVPDHLRTTSLERVSGQPNKDILVEFGDYQCPACTGSAPIVAAKVKAYSKTLDFMFRYWPLPQHRSARHAAIMAEVARMRGKFIPFHDRLMKLRADVSVQNVDKCLAEVGIDPKTVGNQLTSNAEAVVENDMKAAAHLKLESIPTFFVARRDGTVVKLGSLSQFDGVVRSN